MRAFSKNSTVNETQHVDSNSDPIQSPMESKGEVTIGLNFENGSTQTQYISGTVKSLINQINDYKVPETIKNIAVDVFISFDDAELRKLQSASFPEIEYAEVFFYHYLKAIKHQLANKPEQFISSELAANILNIQHESFQTLLKDGKIPFIKQKKSICIRSKDLYEYKCKIEKDRSNLLTQLMQSGI